MSQSLSIDVEEVPEWKIRTPLQRAVQLLKRHRDVHFQDNQESRPVSIIITTLAAHAYQEGLDLHAALIRVVGGMHSYIENRDGVWWVANPADPDENFADKWNERPERREAFMSWLRKARQDFVELEFYPSVARASVALEPILGGPTIRQLSTTASAVPELSDISHCQALGWSEQLQGKARVKGGVYGGRYGSKKLWDLGKRSVPKGVWLRFSMSTSIRQPYDVVWQVVNSGAEAAAAEQLRGDFYNGDDGGKGIRWEETRFRGTHWVEAFVVKDNVCVARSGKKYVRVRGSSSSSKVWN